MLQIRKNCCRVRKKTGSRENLRAIKDADTGVGEGKERTRSRSYSVLTREIIYWFSPELAIQH